MAIGKAITTSSHQRGHWHQTFVAQSELPVFTHLDKEASIPSIEQQPNALSPLMPSRNRSTKTPMRGLVVGVVVTTALVMIVMMIGPAAAWTIVPLTRQTRTTPPSTRLQLFFGRHPLRPPSHGDQNNNNNNDNEDNNNKNNSRPLGALSSSSASTPSSLPQQQQSSTPPPPPPLTFHELERRRMEFFELEPSIETARRKQRREREAFLHSKFAQGNELWNLRRDMDQLAWKLVHALLKRKSESATATDTQNSGSGSNNNAAAAAKAAAEEEAHTREQLRALEQRDPELVYGLEKAAFERANREGGHDSRAASIHRAKALAARSCLPHFNLEGLWVGKYGANGYELINVTYVGDTLVATKLTGDRNVPRGEVSPISVAGGWPRMQRLPPTNSHTFYQHRSPSRST